MVDYSKLAEKAKALQEAAENVSRRHREVDTDPSAFFQKLSVHLAQEMDKANEELRKRGVGLIARNHLPNFTGAIFLAFGTDLLCKVEVEIRKGRGQITASISGPPNGYVSSRKAFFVGRGPSASGTQASGAGLQSAASRPEQVAQEIIAGLLVGRFD
jgi:hypothetical protein